LSLYPGVGGIEFIEYTFLTAIQGVLPKALERKEVESISLSISERRTNRSYERSIMKSGDTK
jgi:hypothetical protein